MTIKTYKIDANPWDLLEDPELGVLLNLQSSIEVAIKGLLAAHPQLADPDPDERANPSNPEPYIAEILIATGEMLQRLVHSYHHLIKHRKQLRDRAYDGTPF